MEGTGNVFTGGLCTDTHPLTTAKDKLTDALNATFITYNGNEYILLNDMGNTMIQDTLTGNIMGLRDGFVPLGMKEYGGVLYIASYNLDTQEGELGSIPSPLISYTESDPESKITEDEMFLFSDVTDTGKNFNAINRVSSEFVKVTDTKLKVGDLFMLQIAIDSTTTNLQLNTYFSNQTNSESIESAINTKTYPILNEFDVNDNIKYGWFDLKLYSLLSSGKYVELTDVTSSPQYYFLESEDVTLKSKYWFIDSTQIKNIDTERCIAADLYKKYPNIPSGYLAIKLSINLPKQVKVLQNGSTLVNLPFTYKTIKI